MRQSRDVTDAICAETVRQAEHVQLFGMARVFGKIGGARILMRGDIEFSRKARYFAPTDSLNWSWNIANRARIEKRKRLPGHASEYEWDAFPPNRHGPDSDESLEDMINSESDAVGFSIIRVDDTPEPEGRGRLFYDRKRTITED